MFNFREYKRTFLILGVLVLAGLVLRLIAYTSFLTYVDSYKYLLQAQSFTNTLAHTFVTQQSGVFAKWGFSLLLAPFSSILHLSAEQLVTAAKLINVGLSLLLAVLIFKLSKKNWLIAVPVFISPLFFGYSSYVISEYLALVLIAAAVLLLQKKLYVPVAIILGFLPFVRIEMTVVSVVLLLFMLKRKQILAALAPAGVTFFATGILLSNFIGGQNFFVTLAGLAANVTYLAIILVLGGVYFALNDKSRKWLTILLGFTIWLYMMFGMVASFTLANAIILDPVLYLFIGVSFGFIINRIYALRLDVPELFLEVVVILAGLIATYTVFNKDIDRYAITIFCLFLMAIAIFLAGYGMSIIHKLAMITAIAGIVIVGRHLLLFSPLPSDYQQYVATTLPPVTDQRVLVSGYQYFSWMYFRGQMPLLADSLTYDEIKSGDVIVTGDDLFAVNSQLYKDIQNHMADFTQVANLPDARIFNYSEALVQSGNDILVLRKN